MNEFRELKKYVEFFSGGVIEACRCYENGQLYGPYYWVAKYSLPDGRMTSTGCIYPSASQAIEEAKKQLTLEAERVYLTRRIDEFMSFLESEGYSLQAILKALAEFSSTRGNWSKVTLILEEAVQVAKDCFPDLD